MPFKISVSADDPSHLDDAVDGILGGLPKGSTPPWLEKPAAAGSPPPAAPLVASRPLTPLPTTLKPYLSMSALGANPTGPGGPPLAPTLLGRVPPAVEPGAVPRTRLGEAKHVLGTIGEIAGSALVPNLMPWIPGTTQNKAMLERAHERQAESESEVQLREAQAAKDLRGEDPALRDVVARYSDALARGDTAEAERLKEGVKQFEATTGKGAGKPETLDQAEAQLFQQRINAGESPIKVLQDIYSARRVGVTPKPSAPSEQAIEAEQILNDPASTPEDKQKAQRHLDAIKAGLEVAKPGEGKGFEEQTFEEAQKSNPNLTREQFLENREGRMAARQAAEQARAFAHQDRLTAARDQAANQKQITKPYQAYEQADENYRFMQGLADEMKKKGKVTGPESIAMLARHMGINFPPGSGMRQSIQMIQAHAEARSYAQGIQAWLQKLDPDAGGVITPEQAKAFVEMANMQRREKYRTLQDESKVYGADISKVPAPAGGEGAAGNSVAYGGKTYNFPDEKSADAFRKELGIK